MQLFVLLFLVMILSISLSVQRRMDITDLHRFSDTRPGSRLSNKNNDKWRGFNDGNAKNKRQSYIYDPISGNETNLDFYDYAEYDDFNHSNSSEIFNNGLQFDFETSTSTINDEFRSPTPWLDEFSIVTPQTLIDDVITDDVNTPEGSKFDYGENRISNEMDSIPWASPKNTDYALLPLKQKILDDMNPLTRTEVEEFQSGNANAYVDFLLKATTNFLPNSIAIVDVDDRYAYNCNLTGLQAGITLQGNSSVEILHQSDALFTFGIKTGNMTINCEWKKTILYLFTMKGYIEVNLAAASFFTQLGMHFFSNDPPILEAMTPRHPPEVTTMKVDGAWLLDCMGDLFLRDKFDTARETIGSQIQTSVANSLHLVLNHMQLPEFKNNMNWLTAKEILTYME